MNACRQTRRGTRCAAPARAPFLSKMFRVALAIAILTPVSWPTASAWEPTPGASAQLNAKLDEPGSMMLRDATLADWVFAIKQEWGINIVTGVDLQNEAVDAGFEETPLREILAEILFVRGFGYQAVGNSLRIVKLEDLGALRPGFETAILPLERLQAIEVEPSIKLLMSPGASVQSIPSSRSLIVVDTPAQIEKIKAHLQILEENARKHGERRAPGGPAGAGVGPDGGPEIASPVPVQRTEVLQVQFLNAVNIVPTIQAVMPSGRVAAMEEENQLVVSGPENEVAAVGDLLKQIDVPRQQVRITALLYDVDLEVLEEFGFNWDNQLKGRLNAAGDPQSLFALSSQNFATTAPADAAAAATDVATSAATGSLGGLATIATVSRHFDMKSVLRALDTTDGSRLLARPNVIAYDRVEAKFQSVSEIPVQQLTQTEAGGNIGTTSFREAGITLTVTPEIMDDGTVKMSVTPEFSVLAGFQGGQPIIDRRSATTTIRLLDGQTTVIGGLVRRNELEVQSGLPHLARMKYLGFLFRDHQTTVTESELLVFIKAEIISTGQPEKERDEAARMVGDDLLNNIPYASHSPITSYCGDPYCPYHHPRPWGSALPPSACTGCESGKHGVPLDEKYYGEGASGRDVVPNPQAPDPRPPVLPPPVPPSESVLPPAPNEATTDNPPPVVIEEARRRAARESRTAMRRLPAVSRPPAQPDVVRATPQLPSQQARPVTPPRSDVRTAGRPGTTAASSAPPAQPTQPPARQADQRPWWKRVFN